jgi:hypothetical protein
MGTALYQNIVHLVVTVIFYICFSVVAQLAFHLKTNIMKRKLLIILIILVCGATQHAAAQCDLKIVVNKSGNQIRTSTPYFSYQWVRCPGYEAIPLATSSSYYVVTSGDYAVIAGDGTCYDTSDCIAVIPTSLPEAHPETEALQFANPARGTIQLRIGGSLQQTSLIVYNIVGRPVYAAPVTASEQQLHLPPGLYTIALMRGGERHLRRLLVQE